MSNDPPDYSTTPRTKRISIVVSTSKYNNVFFAENRILDEEGSDDGSDMGEHTKGALTYTGPHLNFLEWIALAFMTLVFAVVIQLVVFQTFKIPSASMFPTLRIGDHVLVNKLEYDFRIPGIAKPLIVFREPKRSEIVVFKSVQWEGDTLDKHYFIKRIVGIPGDFVQVNDFHVLINGEIVTDDSHLFEPTSGRVVNNKLHNAGPVKLKDNEYYVVGDNRSNSEDSRSFGPISRDRITGKAWVIYWSWIIDRGKFNISWSRIGNMLW